EIEDALQLLARLLLDLHATLAERELQLGLADDLAHRRFSSRTNRPLRIARIEREESDVLDLPDDAEIDVHDVLVTGEHQVFGGLGALWRPGSATGTGAVVADVDLRLFQHVLLDDGADRPGPVPAQSLADRLAERAAKDHLDRLLAGLHAEEA